MSLLIAIKHALLSAVWFIALLLFVDGKIVDELMLDDLDLKLDEHSIQLQLVLPCCMIDGPHPLLQLETGVGGDDEGLRLRISNNGNCNNFFIKIIHSIYFLRHLRQIDYAHYACISKAI